MGAAPRIRERLALVAAMLLLSVPSASAVAADAQSSLGVSVRVERGVPVRPDAVAAELRALQAKTLRKPSGPVDLQARCHTISVRVQVQGATARCSWVFGLGAPALMLTLFY